jgi:riboflavin synthase
MFTGLVEAIGTIVAIHRKGDAARLTIAAPFEPSSIPLGDSVAVNGACLTVVSVSEGSFDADVSHETVARTTLSDAKVGSAVHLERALRVGDRMGGHMVQGHVDFKARVRSVRRTGNAWDIGIEVPPEHAPFVVEKGSVALDGVSLTVNTVRDGELGVTIVPHTGQMTLLTRHAVGDWVNVETDIIGKYVVHALRRLGGPGGGIDVDFLKKHGFA